MSKCCISRSRQKLITFIGFSKAKTHHLGCPIRSALQCNSALINSHSVFRCTQDKTAKKPCIWGQVLQHGRSDRMIQKKGLCIFFLNTLALQTSSLLCAFWSSCHERCQAPSRGFLRGDTWSFSNPSLGCFGSTVAEQKSAFWTHLDVRVQNLQSKAAGCSGAPSLVRYKSHCPRGEYVEGYRMTSGVTPRKVGWGGEEPPWWLNT